MTIAPRWHEKQDPPDPFFEKGLPSNLEAERSTLGAILIDNTVSKQARETMSRDDLFLDSHRRIFDKMMALDERGEIIDLITLGEELRRSGEFEQIGGATYIASLIDGVPRTDTIEPYVKIVKEKALLRRIIRAADLTLEEAFDGEFESDEIRRRALSRMESTDDGGSSISNRHTQLIAAGELEKLPTVEWLIDGEIPRRSLAFLYGESGSGKSFVALDYAARIAQTESVVYVAAEGSSGYASRLAAWRKANQKDSGRLYFYLDAVQMLNPAAVRGFIREIRSVSPALVVLDTLARCMVGGDENSAKDMGLFLDSCSQIIAETGATDFVVHHKGKTGTSPRGSSALVGAGDMIAELTNDDGLIQLRCTKMKDAPEFEPRYLRLVELEGSCAIYPADRVITDNTKLTSRQRQILEVFALTIYEDTGIRYRQLEEITKIPSSTLAKSLSALKSGAFIHQSDHGDPYFITPKGLKALESTTAPPDDGGGKSDNSKDILPELHSLHSNSTFRKWSSGNGLAVAPLHSTAPLKGAGASGVERAEALADTEEGAL